MDDKFQNLIDTARRVSRKFGRADDGTPSDWKEWSDLRNSLDAIFQTDIDAYTYLAKRFDSLMQQNADLRAQLAQLAVRDDIARRVVEAGGLPKPVYGESPLKGKYAEFKMLEAMERELQRWAATFRPPQKEEVPITPIEPVYDFAGTPYMTTEPKPPCTPHVLTFASIIAIENKRMHDKVVEWDARAAEHKAGCDKAATEIRQDTPMVCEVTPGYTFIVGDVIPGADNGYKWVVLRVWMEGGKSMVEVQKKVSDPEDDDEEDDGTHTPHPLGPDIGEAGAKATARMKSITVAQEQAGLLHVRRGTVEDVMISMAEATAPVRAGYLVEPDGTITKGQVKATCTCPPWMLGSGLPHVAGCPSAVKP